MPTEPRARRLHRAAVALAIFAGVTAVLSLPIEICPFALATRHPCPGCGMTRAVIHAAHGDLAQSLHTHPLALILAPVLFLFLGRNTLGWIQRGRWGEADAMRGKWLDRVALPLALVMIVVWIARFFGAFGGPVPVG